MSNPRRRSLADFSPAQRAAIEAVQAANRTPERKAEDARIRELVVAEFPPKAPDPALIAALSALREERQRQGLTLEAVSQRTGLDRAVISKLENGKVLNPTIATLKAYASALGKTLAWSIEDLRPTSR